jgi:hypothetical protein
MITGVSGVVIGFTILWIIHKMVDGELGAGPGILAIGVSLWLIMMAVVPPHPAAPGVILIVVLSLMAFFPYASGVLERTALQEIDTALLDKAHRAIHERPDNFNAYFDISRALYGHGMRCQAIAIANRTLQTLSARVDPVQNRSMRDVFRSEEGMVQRWVRYENSLPESKRSRALNCPNCGSTNPPEQLACVRCQRPYLLELARSTNSQSKVIAKLVFAWALVGLFLVGGILLLLAIPGPLRYVALVAALGAMGFVLNWLFRSNPGAPRGLIVRD